MLNNDHKILESLEPESFIPVVFDNTKSGKGLYISVKRAQGPWLALGGDGRVKWQNKFDANCEVYVAESTNYIFPFISYEDDMKGARMYLSTESLNGNKPILTTASFIFDKIELGWNAVWNQTSVDFFGIPVQLEHNGKVVGYKDTDTRESIINKLLQLPNPYNQFVYPVGATKANEVVRFFSPSMALSMTAKPWSYPSVSGLLDEAIKNGLPMLKGACFNYGGFIMQFGSASVQDRTLSLSVTDSKGKNPEDITLSSICSANAFSDTIQCTPTTQSGKKAAGLIGAAINRGVLSNPRNWGESGNGNHGYPQYYYKDTTDNCNQFNHYAHCLHEVSINQLCYAISYDDFFHQDASINPKANQWVRITVLPFSG